MNRYLVWTVIAVAMYWLAVAALGTDATRNVVASIGIVIAFATLLRYLAVAFDKFRKNQFGGEWRMLIGLELFWFLFGGREIWLMGGRVAHWPVENSPVNGFFALGFACAGLLCYSAADDPVPSAPHQNAYLILATGVIGVLVGMLVYRLLWG